MPGQVAFARDTGAGNGLRERKKIKTRLAIEEAALALFEEQGYDATTVEEIAARADVSTTTFFRYYPTKAEVLVAEHGGQLPALHQAIVERPRDEDDLVAIRHAVQEHWVAAVDADLTARKAKVVETSDLLRGLSYHRGQRWLAVFSDALAQRHGRDTEDERCELAARVALDALASAVQRWTDRGCAGDLAPVVAQSFDRMAEVCGSIGRTRTTSKTRSNR